VYYLILILFLHPSNKWDRRHYVFRLSVLLCVHACKCACMSWQRHSLTGLTSHRVTNLRRGYMFHIRGCGKFVARYSLPNNSNTHGVVCAL